MEPLNTKEDVQTQRERIEIKARERLYDRLGDLPDCILLCIMELLNTKEAVQTCVLSKRWTNIWKYLPNLTLNSSDPDFFSKFVASVLSCRDHSTPIHSLDLKRKVCIHPKLLNEVMIYAASHDVQQFMIDVTPDLKLDFELSPCIFYCRSLTSLKLSFSSRTSLKLPKSLELPALESLHLEHVTFTTSDNGCAEPFSTCKLLHTLVIQDCALQRGAEVLFISNSRLSSLNFIRTYVSKNTYKIMLSTPNLILFTVKGLGFIHKIPSSCSLPLLEEVYMGVFGFKYIQEKVLFLTSWFEMVANVKIMTLSLCTFNLLNGFLSHGSIMMPQPPCFVRLESLTLELPIMPSDEEVSRTVEYLLQNSQSDRVDIKECIIGYC